MKGDRGKSGRAKEEHPAQQDRLVDRRIGAKHLSARNRQRSRQRRIHLTAVQQLVHDRPVVKEGIVRGHGQGKEQRQHNLPNKDQGEHRASWSEPALQTRPASVTQVTHASGTTHEESGMACQWPIPSVRFRVRFLDRYMPLAAAIEEPTVPLCVDLDGTLVRTDLLWESLVRLLRRNPLYALAVPFWFLRGR